MQAHCLCCTSVCPKSLSLIQFRWSKGTVHPITGHEGPEGEYIYIYSYTLSLTSALNGGGWSTTRPGRFTSGKETRYPLYRRLDGPQGRSGRTRKISPPIGIRSPDRPARSENFQLWCGLNIWPWQVQEKFEVSNWKVGTPLRVRGGLSLVYTWGTFIFTDITLLWVLVPCV